VIAGRIADVDQLRVFRANLPFLWAMLGIFALDPGDTGARHLAAEHRPRVDQAGAISSIRSLDRALRVT
jgi:hypothetical protein